ncbi:hypothetical protein EUTSA_v10027055mg [Eutrema salsugineum]|uniref:F-box associated beta-propeller type 1 domain-containing protein n=1 Tax=Eutrema salsugineum TaxID=72664 RepID=V4P945_EUTSA|nr:hypothetical protein EUTSA_v10027055mg [Eutrema salsugineum]
MKMRREIKREPMKFTDLPQELESEILSRFRPQLYTSTCKRWCALFKDSRFIKNNLDKAATQVILKKDNSVYSFTGKLKSLKDSEEVTISSIFHCNGLLLCTTEENRLVVWNPCTGRTRWIQTSWNSNKTYYNYVLGYQSNNKSCDSYKILRFGYYYNDLNDLVHEFKIYELNSDSWGVLDDVNEQNWTTIRSRRVSLKGNTYWAAWENKNPFTNRFLLRFNFKRERFERFSLLFQCNDFHVRLVLSVVKDEQLYVLLQSPYRDIKMKIWVTDTKIDEAKDTNIQSFSVVYFGDIMRTSMTAVESFSVVYCRRDRKNKETMFYIVGGDHKIHVCKQAQGWMAQGPYDNNCPLLVSYVPSLVEIQQMEENGKGG